MSDGKAAVKRLAVVFARPVQKPHALLRSARPVDNGYAARHEQGVEHIANLGLQLLVAAQYDAERQRARVL